MIEFNKLTIVIPSLLSNIDEKWIEQINRFNQEKINIIICIPPNGKSILRTFLPIKSSFSNNSGVSMETSSIIKASVDNQLILAAYFLDIFKYKFSAVSSPKPIDAHECSVFPLIKIA